MFSIHGWASGYIPFYKILDANRQYNIADIVKICENMGFGKECKEMFFLDSIIFKYHDSHSLLGKLIHVICYK